MNHGYRLRNVGSDEFTWRDLKVFIQHMDVHDNLFAIEHPDKAGWDKANMLAADIADSLNWLVWAKTKDGQKNRNQPQPIPRPGVQSTKKRTKGEALPIDQFRSKLAELRARMKSSTSEEQVTRISVRRMKEAQKGKT